jgi:hypothetical protein
MEVMRTGDGGGAIVAGHRDKYALVERERRFLLAAPPSGASLTDERQITDRHLTGTRLRRTWHRPGGGKPGIGPAGQTWHRPTRRPVIGGMGGAGTALSYRRFTGARWPH